MGAPDRDPLVIAAELMALTYVLKVSPRCQCGLPATCVVYSDYATYYVCKRHRENVLPEFEKGWQFYKPGTPVPSRDEISSTHVRIEELPTAKAARRFAALLEQIAG